MKKDLTPAAQARQAALALLRQLHYEESIVAYERHLDETPGEDMAALDGLARAYLAAGRYREAIPLFERVGRSEQQELAGGINRRDVIAVLHWLLGERAVARTLIKEVVTGRLEGSIIYGDGAGGATQGLLLHYMAVSDGVTEDVQYAVDYLERLRGEEGEWEAHWPGPAALYVLQRIDLATLFEAATKEKQLSAAMQAAATDLLKRRHLAVALFHAGVVARKRGDEHACQQLMKDCNSLANPVIELSWYLARFEAQERAAQSTAV
jgi:tetratricopeptide (TPR) repeat protein